MRSHVLGIRANAKQFALLVTINAFVGAMVGIERSTIPILARTTFGLATTTATLSFIVAFGAAKAVTNFVAGRTADRIGRRRLLIAGWLIALPTPAIVIFAPSWAWVVCANVLLGVSQGLTWSMTVVMKVDLARPDQRGLATGANETAGYLAVAVAAAAAGALTGAHGPRPAPFILGLAIAAIGLSLSLFVKDTGPSGSGAKTGAVSERRRRSKGFSALAQAGLVNNLNDAMFWGLVPLFLATRGLSGARIGVIAAAYPLAWGIGQLPAGALSDRIGRRAPITAGMLIQAVAIASFAHANGGVAWTIAAIAMGLGTALAYPTLIAAVADASDPNDRAEAIGAYRFWRDSGYVVGALIAGTAADTLGMRAAMDVIAALTAASAVYLAVRSRASLARTLGQLR